jgi:hypothetical protein
VASLLPCTTPAGVALVVASAAVVTLPAGSLSAGDYRFDVHVTSGVADGLVPNNYRSAR